MRNSVLGLLLCASLAWARDPFQPLRASACPAEYVSLSGWRLEGILGVAPDFVGWLISDRGSRYRVTPQMILPGTAWQVAHLSARTLVVSTTEECAQQQHTWTLQGGMSEKDTSAARLPEPATARQRRASEPGV
ncbi:HofP DNA utilization family protein [Pantoea sp.]|uniref:HofP DNA utilization family protein n=1 Tax=Pantoea sp. TaxID=69393 RepID=UPI0031E40D91